jgi:mono/diheme cytochrome c family protein
LRVIKRSLKWTAACFAAVAAIATASVQTAVPSGAAQPAAAGDQALVDQGKTTYAENCSHCHGPGMMNAGTITPDLRRFPDDKARFFTTVKNGKNGKMPPWGDLLNDDQIGALWAYVSSQRKP